MSHPSSSLLIRRVRRCCGALSLAILSFVALSFLTACDDSDGDPYPSLITELVMASSDAQCVFSSFTTDDGRSFTMTNTVKGPTANVRWRFFCGYVEESPGQARVYSLSRVPLLSDFCNTPNPRHDPTGLASMWASGGYLNLHLLPKTKGGKQAWGFTTDSTHVNDAGGTNYYLSLCHYQLEDQEAYTEDLFLSIDPDSITPHWQSRDSLVFSLRTYNGWQTRGFTFSRTTQGS